MTEKLAEVHRLLDRYLVEVVEAYNFCPWARQARSGGELATAVLWGQPEVDAFCAAARDLLARTSTRVAMVIAPELAVTPAELRVMRDRVAAHIKHAGVAEFHPDAPLDVVTPARLVPYVRRSPDPLLQLVPLAILDSVRAQPPPPGLAEQALILSGVAPAPRGDVADRIAEMNHARVVRDREALEATLADIAADRARSYARVGIGVRAATGSTSR